MKKMTILFVTLTLIASASYAALKKKEVVLRDDLVLSNLGYKIIYLMKDDVSQKVYEKDCTARKGEFDDCGKFCDERIKDQFCPEFCTYTCEFEKK